MHKSFKPITLMILFCFIFTYTPFPSFAKMVKAADNDRVTYQADTHGEILINQKFTLSISANYDDTPMTKLSFIKLRGFQLIGTPADDEFQMQAPPDGNKIYSLLMEGTANDRSKVTFSIPITVANKASSMSISTEDNPYNNSIFWLGIPLLILYIAAASK